MLYVRPVLVLAPADELFGLIIPNCNNTVSTIFNTAYLVCPPSEKDAPDVFAVDLENAECRSRIVKLFVGESGLYATPYFAGSDFGCWRSGGAYILVPLEPRLEYGCGYGLKINNTAVPLYDFWEQAEEPKEASWLF